MDDLDGRVRRFPSIFFTLRIVNAQPYGAGFGFRQKGQKGQRAAAQIRYFALRQVFRINPAVILPNEILGLSNFPPLPLSKVRHYLFDDFGVFFERLQGHASLLSYSSFSPPAEAAPPSQKKRKMLFTINSFRALDKLNFH